LSDSTSIAGQEAHGWESIAAHLVRGEICSVRCPPEVEVWSLLQPIARRLHHQKVRTLTLDLGLIPSSCPHEEWYHALASQLGRQSKSVADLEQRWLELARQSPAQRLFTLLCEVVSPTQTERCVVFLTRLESIRRLTFSTDEFLALLRESYNRRAWEADRAKVTFCLIGAAWPAELIRDVRSTPFNVGESIDLTSEPAELANPGKAQALQKNAWHKRARQIIHYFRGLFLFARMRAFQSGGLMTRA